MPCALDASTPRRGLRQRASALVRMRPRGLRCTLMLGLTLALQSAAQSQPCEGNAYRLDKDPHGTRIRSAPGAAPVLRVIPHDEDGSIVELSESSRNWLRIRAFETLSSGAIEKVDGWVHAPLMAVRATHPSAATVALLAGPDAGAAVLAQIASDTDLPLRGCQGRWRRVQAGALSGWLAPGNYCWTPVSTCP